jgi:hypothetical protein
MDVWLPVHPTSGMPIADPAIAHKRAEALWFCRRRLISARPVAD